MLTHPFRRALAAAGLVVLIAPWHFASAQSVSPVERLPLPSVSVDAQGRSAGGMQTDPGPASGRGAGQGAAPDSGARSAAPTRQWVTLPGSNEPVLLALPPARQATDFERLATAVNGGRPLWRFGTEPRESPFDEAATAGPVRVPPDYPVQVGDELLINVWGTVEGEWRLNVDRGGRVVLPRVGPVAVAGVVASELPARLRERLQLVYLGFDLGVAITDVAPIRVRVTGFVEEPGDRVLPGLSTLSQALARLDVASTGGSLRQVRLRREGVEITAFDRYALLVQGSAADDPVLLPGDVIHVEPVGPQVAVFGAVNRMAVFETLPGQTMAEVLQLAGGFSAVADGDRVELERRRGNDFARIVQLRWPDDATFPLADGDLLRVPSRMEAARPSLLGNKRVRIEGEVMRPGDYVLPPEASLADAVAAAGGSTPEAFLFGLELRRERVRLLQEANYLRALEELEAEAARLATVRGSGGDNPAAQESALRDLIARLRLRRPEGRLVLDLAPDASALPTMVLEDGDFVRVPPRNQSVGVFGTVFSAGSFVHDGELTLGDFVARAGGPTASAEAGSMFVVRANGSVLSARQGGWWSGRAQFEAEPALPGDTVFVPEKLNRVTVVQGAKDWTQILYQLGIGLAALLTIL
jgi:protein involved in polysaccharide export with SLBB domain